MQSGKVPGGPEDEQTIPGEDRGAECKCLAIWKVRESNSVSKYDKKSGQKQRQVEAVWSPE